MSSLGITQRNLLDLHWQGTLSDYVTALDWTAKGDLGASTASGEVVLWRQGILTTLQSGYDSSVDCLAFSADGQFLAASGQDGRVKIWHLPENQLIHTLENAPAWVDQLAWCPTRQQLAFSIGRYIQILDIPTGEIAATLNFETSTVLGLTWHPKGQHAIACGNQGVKIWHAQAWDDDPSVLDLPVASIAIACSPNGKYLATGNLGNTLNVWEWNNPMPWVMRGFPGKIRNLAWSKPKSNKAPILAASSVEGIVIWEKSADELTGWEGRVLEGHEGTV